MVERPAPTEARPKRAGRAPVRSNRLLGGPPASKIADVTKAAKDLLEDALRLDVAERAKLAERLLASLDGEADEDVEAAWAAEAERRMNEIQAGTAKLVHWEDVKRRVEKKLLKR